jgi:hypothetical protein
MQRKRLAVFALLCVAGGLAASDATRIGVRLNRRALFVNGTPAVTGICFAPVGSTCEATLVLGRGCASGDVVAGPSSFDIGPSGRTRIDLFLLPKFFSSVGTLRPGVTPSFTLCATVDPPRAEPVQIEASNHVIVEKLLVSISLSSGHIAEARVHVTGLGDVLLAKLTFVRTKPVETIETTLLLPHATGEAAVSLAAGGESCNGTPISDTVTTTSGGGNAGPMLQLNALGQELVAKYRRLQAIQCSEAQDPSGTTVAVKKRHVILVGPRS